MAESTEQHQRKAAPPTATAGKAHEDVFRRLLRADLRKRHEKRQYRQGRYLSRTSRHHQALTRASARPRLEPPRDTDRLVG